MHGGLLFESDDKRGAVGDRLDAQGHDYGVEHAVPAGGTVGLNYDGLVPAAADSLEAAVLVSKFHFRRHERERFGILELHSSFQTESRYHDAQAAALHDASDVAALNAPAQNVTVLQFVNEERRRQEFDVRFAREVAQGIPAGGGSVQHEKAAQLDARALTGDSTHALCTWGSGMS